MKSKRLYNAEKQAAFVMEAGDCFHFIIVSDPVHFEVQPDAETIITFFVIRRVSGNYDIINVLKTFQKDNCVSRNVQTKTGISDKALSEQIDNVRIGFALAIEKQTGFKLNWNTLDLSDTTDCKEQIRRIQAWGRLGVRFAPDLPSISLN